MAVVADRSAKQLNTSTPRRRTSAERPSTQGRHAIERPTPSDTTFDAGRPGWVKPTAMMLGVLLVGLLVVIAVFGSQAVGGLLTEWGRSNALDAAETAATNLTTFDAGSADQNTQRFLDTTSTQFAQGFLGDKGSFIKSLQDGKVSMTGKVVDAGVVDYDGDTAHVFVAVRAQVSDSQSPQPHARDYRMEFTMVHDHGWKLDRIEFVA